MPPDVAGATFMAAGSSGPELATAIIGVFVAKVLITYSLTKFYCKLWYVKNVIVIINVLF